MILRRIAEAFRQQDWLTVLVEIMIVVMGVFLGLQVNNWNEARQDRAREALYLERLHADVEMALGTTLQLGDRVARRVAEADRVSDAICSKVRVIACIEEPQLIRKILDHVRKRDDLSESSARGPPGDGAAGSRLV